MKYVVTGGAGFIGSNIVEALVKKGEEVIVIDDLSTGKKENIDEFKDKIDFVEGSITDLKLLKDIFKGANYVLHLAAIASVPLSIKDPILTNKVNAEGTLNVLLAAKEAGVKRVVFSSSCAIYGDSDEMPKVEPMLPDPLTPYSLTKLAGEYYCKIFNELYGVETVCLRYFNIFGPRQDPNSQYSAVIPIFITKMLKDEQPTIFGDGLTSRDFVFVENVVQANLLACSGKDADGKVFNIGSGKEVSLLELLQKINAVLGKDVKPIHEKEREGDIKHSLSEISEAKRFLSFQLSPDFDEGLRKTIEWYKKNIS